MRERPEDAFTKKSKKRYKALRRITERIVVPEGWTVIAGRQRGHSKPSDVVYVEVRTSWWLDGEHRRKRHLMRRYYLDHKPTRKSIRQIVKMQMELMSIERP